MGHDQGLVLLCVAGFFSAMLAARRRIDLYLVQMEVALPARPRRTYLALAPASFTSSGLSE